MTETGKATYSGDSHYGYKWHVLGWCALGFGLPRSLLAGLLVNASFLGDMDIFTHCTIGMERYDEARAFVVEYHANGDPNHPIVELEMNEMTASMREQGILSWRNFFDIRMLFKSRSRRYRMMLNIAMSWFGQFSGLTSTPPLVDHARSIDHLIPSEPLVMRFREQHCILLSSPSGCKCRNNRPSYSAPAQWDLCSDRMDCSGLWSPTARYCWPPQNVVWKVRHLHSFGDFVS